MKFFNVALGIVLASTTLTASAQKSYTSGSLTMGTNVRGMALEMKVYFTPDSAVTSFNSGPANIKILTDTKNTIMDIFVDVPSFSVKKVAVATPAEIEDALSDAPVFTFAPSTETKVISNFNCKKVVATDTKTTKTYDIWITNDFTLPKNVIPKYYATIGGVPIQFASFQKGQSTVATITKVSDEKVPAGSFGVSADYEKITMDELKAMSGGGN